MQSMLLGCATAIAVTALAAAPAQAQNGTSRSNGVTVHRGFGEWDGGNGDRHQHRRRGEDIRFGGPGSPRADAVVVDWGFGYGSGEWARYNNRSFEPDSYNDWWHERPNRAYPRWMQSGTCDRQWWGGGTWRCSW